MATVVTNTSTKPNAYLIEGSVSMNSATNSSSMSSQSNSIEELDEKLSDPIKLHESVSKKFNRGANGEMITTDLKSIFSVLIIALDLKEHHLENRSALKLFHVKSHPFSFSIEEAVEKMHKLEIKVDLAATMTTLSYSIKSSLALKFLKKFMRAKLIHSPAERTRSVPKKGVILQPTPKRCAILQKFCSKIGLRGEQIPSILATNFNSMDLICLERHPMTDLIVHSEYLISVLFSKFMGPKPNVWSAAEKAAIIPSRAIKSNDLSAFNNPERFDAGSALRSPQKLKSIAQDPEIQRFEKSPFHHRFFTNPESDAHIQYYVSENGVRLFKNKQFGESKPVFIDYCFSGKAAVQWFMDCTAVFNSVEASELVLLFLKHGVIEPVSLSPSVSPKSGFSSSSSSYYVLTKKGVNRISWLTKASFTTENADKMQGQQLTTASDITLQEVLEDPGCKYLFRKHLEQHVCVENLDVYTEILEFQKLMLVTKRLSKAKEKSKDLSDDKGLKARVLVRTLNECLTKAYGIYSSYLSFGAPYETNISDVWKRQAQAILIDPNALRDDLLLMSPVTPVMRAFPQNVLESEGKANGVNGQLSAPEQNDLGLLKAKAPPSPGQCEISEGLQVLNQIEPLFEKINQHILFLLSQDSFPKFVKSSLFQGDIRRIGPDKSVSGHVEQ